MTTAAKTSLRLAFFVAISLQAQNAPVESPVQIANDEAVRRQEKTILLHQDLEQARAALKRNQLLEAAKLYQSAVARIPEAQVGNAAVDAEKKQALVEFDAVWGKLALQAMQAGDVNTASDRLKVALKADPANEELLHLKAEIARRTAELAGRMPSREVMKKIADLQTNRLDNATRVQDAKVLYEAGKYDEAEGILNQVMKDEPGNRTAPYYLDLIKEARYMDAARHREAGVKSAIGDVEGAWVQSDKRGRLPHPNNPMATTNLAYTTHGRQQILTKLENIMLNEVSYDLPLKEVLGKLRTESQKRDPEGVGINFMINQNVDTSGLMAPTDTTGAAVVGAVPATAQQQDIGSEVTIRLSPPLSNLRLVDVLDVIQKVADKPIRWTVEDYAVVFSPKPMETAQLYTKVFSCESQYLRARH